MSRLLFTFDCYGTLIDWLGGIRKEIRELYPNLRMRKINKFISYWSEKDLELVRQDYRTYREILGKGFVYALRKSALPYDEEILEKLVQSIKEWKPFPDTRKNLMTLKKVGELGIISNTDREFIEASIANMNIDFDHTIVAEDMKMYKPNPEVFGKAKDMMRVDRGDVWIHISSYPAYDIIPAKKMNIYSILLDRYSFSTEMRECYADEVYRDFSILTEKIMEKFR